MLLLLINKMLTSGLKYISRTLLQPLLVTGKCNFLLDSWSIHLLPVCQLHRRTPLIGPLHISLNARECVLLNFHDVFANLYAFIFWTKAKLAKKPKPSPIYLLLEVIYGGWTLIRTSFSRCSIKAKMFNF